MESCSFSFLSLDPSFSIIVQVICAYYSSKALEISKLSNDNNIIFQIRRAARRFLRRSQSVDVRSRPFSFKRDPPTDENTPVQNKRQRRPIKEDDHHEDSQLSKQVSMIVKFKDRLNRSS